MEEATDAATGRDAERQRRDVDSTAAFYTPDAGDSSTRR
jgi:hypothetical protein